MTKRMLTAVDGVGWTSPVLARGEERLDNNGEGLISRRRVGIGLIARPNLIGLMRRAESTGPSELEACRA